MPSARESRQDDPVVMLRRRIARLEAQLADCRRQSITLQNESAIAGEQSAGVDLGLGTFSEDLSRAVFVSSDMARVVGRTVAELEADPACWLRSVDAEDLPRVRQAVMSAEPAHELRFRIYREGEIRWILSRFMRQPGRDDVPSRVFLFADVTEQNLHEAALHASEARFRALAVHSPMGIFQCDLTAACLFANDRFSTITGISGYAWGGAWYQNVHPDDCARVTAAWQEATDWGAEFVCEFRFLHEDGAVRWVLVGAVPLVGDTGEVICYLGNLLDITERRAAEEALRDSEERFRLLGHSAPVGIFLTDESGQAVYVNRRLQEIYTYSAAELLGMGFARVWLPAERETNLANWMRVASTTDPHDADRMIVNGRGEVRWIHVHSAPMVASNGTVLGRIGTVEDITRRRLAEQELRAGEARLRAILDTASDGIVTVDASGTIEQFNPGAERVFGYTKAEVLGRNIAMLMTGEQPRGDTSSSRRPAVFRRPLRGTREIVGRRKDGSLFELEVRVAETLIGGRSIFTAILRDVAERKRTERRLRESDRLAATGRITTRIAHEINNPLASIKNAFLLVKDSIPTNDKYYPYVARIESEIDRIARIVRQMFDLYRPSHSAAAPIDLSATIHHVVALLEPIATSHDVALHHDTSACAVSVEMSTDSVREVLYNLIINAIEASPRGGAVDVTAHSTERGVDVFVADGGPGIPIELHTQIYEPFFTTKAHAGTGGMGLGLSISRGVVEAMQGSLDFKCEPGRGTVFHLHFPADKHGQESSHATDTENPVR